VSGIATASGNAEVARFDSNQLRARLNCIMRASGRLAGRQVDLGQHAGAPQCHICAIAARLQRGLTPHLVQTQETPL
jgi:hypothetical protein